MTAPGPAEGAADAGTTVEALRDQSQRLGLTWQLQTGTVTVGTNRAAIMVVVDGDTAAIPAASMIGRVGAGSRVYVITVPPAGTYVVGYARDYAMPAPTVTATTGTPSSGTTEVRDAVLGSYEFDSVEGVTYRIWWVGEMNSPVAGDRILSRIRDGGNADPTPASDLVADSKLWYGEAGTLGRQSQVATGLMVGTGEHHTLSAFSLDADSGIATPVGIRTLYAEPIGVFQT